MAAWVIKTEPGCYSFDDLERDGATTWDGITNAAALKNLRLMRPGERCFVYHTGDERRIVGVAKVEAGPYADPKHSDEKLVVVDLAFDRRLKRPVTLAEIRAEPNFADWALVRQGRLSVAPTPPEIWMRVLELAGENRTK